jgi:hypothetical protein
VFRAANLNPLLIVEDTPRSRRFLSDCHPIGGRNEIFALIAYLNRDNVRFEKSWPLNSNGNPVALASA